MGRQDIFPVAVFGILLVAALAGIIAINTTIGPLRLPTENTVGQSSVYLEPLNPAIYAPTDDPFTEAELHYVEASANTSHITVSVSTEEEVVQQYVYKEGYYAKGIAGTQWTKFTFPNTAVGTTKWIAGEAAASIATASEGGSQVSVIVFVCRKYAGDEGYVCGPRGSTKNYSMKNWTGTVTYISPDTIVVTTCRTDLGAFCAPKNTSPLKPEQNKTIYSGSFPQLPGLHYQPCEDSNKICYKCAEGFTNDSNGQCFNPEAPPTCTNLCQTAGETKCTLDGKNQTCKSVDGCLNWSLPVACPSGKTCFDKECTNSVTTACTLKPGQVCAPPNSNLANRTSNQTGTCTNGNTCYRCDDGYEFYPATNSCRLNCKPENCPSTKVCDPVTKACVPPPAPGCNGCLISTCIANGTVNPANSCQWCINTTSTTGWTTKPAQCPAQSTVACGTAIAPTNGCGTCIGNGTKCATAGQSCNTTTWTCQTGCTPVAAQCTYTTTCSTTGTDNCNNANAAICNRNTENSACTTADSKAGTCKAGACQATCTKKTCAADYAGKCGTSLSDGCGGTINCGCASGTCSTSAAGQAGTCQTPCTPKTCSDYPDKCGKIDNGCGGTISCGSTCASGKVCSAYDPTQEAGTCVTPDACTTMSGSLSCPKTGCAKSSKVTLEMNGVTYSDYQMCCDSATQCADIAPEAYRGGTAKCYDIGGTYAAGSQQYVCESGNNWKKCDGANQPKCSPAACKYVGATPTPVGTAGNTQYCSGCSTSAPMGTTLTAAKNYNSGTSGAVADFYDGTKYYGSCCAAGSCADIEGRCYTTGQLYTNIPWYLCKDGAFAVCKQDEARWDGSKQQSLGEYWCPQAGDASGSFGWTKTCGADGQAPCNGHICKAGLGRCNDKCITQSACAALFGNSIPNDATCGGHGEWPCGTTPACTTERSTPCASAGYLCWNSCPGG